MNLMIAGFVDIKEEEQADGKVKVPPCWSHVLVCGSALNCDRATGHSAQGQLREGSFGRGQDHADGKK